MAMDGNGKQVLQLDKFKSDSRIISFVKNDDVLIAEDEMVIPEDNELEEVYQALVIGAEGLYRKKQISWSNYRIIRWD